MYLLHHSELLEWISKYQGPQFHAVLSDPPYHLTSITERFGKEGSKPAKFGDDGAFSRASRGFMQTSWDGGDIAFRAETWEAIKSVVLPGAFGMAFASSRGYHRMAAAIEDAGFIIHPSIFLWCRGTGFPKATTISGQCRTRRGAVKFQHGYALTNWAMENLPYEERLKWYRHEKAMAGHRYGGQVLKPAVEPIIVFQKLYDGKALENILETGAGCLNIKNSQIKFNEDRGRWPANFIVDQESADLLDQQSGVLNSGKGHVVKRSKGNGFRQIALGDFRNLAEQHYETFGDSGGASRFFFQYQENQIDEADLVKYTTKASNAERDAGISRNPTKVNDGRPSEIDNPYQRGETERINIHPTTKPIDLTRYLASILLPPEEYGTRRLFVPFAGVASEMIGGLLAGWDEAVGVEMEKEYVEIGNQRLQHWQQFAPVPHVKDGPIQQTLF